MAEAEKVQSKGFSIDWLVKGTLTKVGDIFDRLTGRGWKPSSSLATSELIERMKALMDAEVRTNEKGQRFVPHNVKLKMQWDKFSTDSEKNIEKLRNEFLVAAVDHINDKHYFTHAPLAVEIKPDYFTSGVKLYVGFEKLEAEEREAEVHVTVDGPIKVDLAPAAEPELQSLNAIFRFTVNGKALEKRVRLEEKKRVSVGRTKENGLQIDDSSVSKAHASIMLNAQREIVVADTGSTNGTFVGGQRIPYGKALKLASGQSLLFGTVNVAVEIEAAATQAKTEVLPAGSVPTEVGGLTFRTREGIKSKAVDPMPSVAAPTAPAINIAKPEESGVAAQPPLSEPNIEVEKK